MECFYIPLQLHKAWKLFGHSCCCVLMKTFSFSLFGLPGLLSCFGTGGNNRKDWSSRGDQSVVWLTATAKAPLRQYSRRDCCASLVCISHKCRNGGYGSSIGIGIKGVSQRDQTISWGTPNHEISKESSMLVADTAHLRERQIIHHNSRHCHNTILLNGGETAVLHVRLFWLWNSKMFFLFTCQMWYS